MRKLLPLLVLSLIVLAASTAHAGSGSGRTLFLKADKTALKFDKTILKAEAGRVTIVMSNPAPMPHNVAVKGHGVKMLGKVVFAGGRSVLTVTLKRGTYEFYCSVPGHEQAGMKGTLVVR